MKNYRDINDYELIYLVEEENEEALGLLFQKYQPLINSIVSRFYRSMKQFGIDYDDLYQEAIVSFNRAIRLYREEENTLFYTFLMINIQSKLLNYMRTLTSQKNLVLNNSVSLSIPVTEDGMELEEILVNKRCVSPNEEQNYQELLESLKTFTWELSDVQAQIFELLCNGFSNIEIGHLLDIDPKDVSNNLYRIRKRLRLYLNC